MTTGDATSERRRAAVADIALVVGVSGLAFLAELAAAEYLPWGDEGRGVIAVLAGAVTALWVTHVRGRKLADLGFRRPGRWSTVPLWAIGIVAAYVIAQGLAPLLVQPFFILPEPDLSRYDSIRGNAGAALAMLFLLPLTAAIPEEIVYRGFLIERLARVFGSGRPAAWLAVAGQALIFGSVHFQWGPGGIIVTTIMGAVWGAAFLLCGRNLWIVIIAHSTAHAALILQLYLSPAPG